MRRNRPEQHEKALTVADLSQAIELQHLPYTRQGHEYVVRRADVRKLLMQHGQTIGVQQEIPQNRVTLEVGRLA